MQFSSILAIIASVAMVSAAPLVGELPTPTLEPTKPTTLAKKVSPTPTPAAANNSGQICKVDQKQACCKTDSAGVLGGLLGGSCELNIRMCYRKKGQKETY